MEKTVEEIEIMKGREIGGVDENSMHEPFLNFVYKFIYLYPLSPYNVFLFSRIVVILIIEEMEFY